MVALLGNVGITMRFQSGTSHSIRFSASGDLADLIDTSYPLMRHRFGMYAELARLAHGSTLMVPPDHPIDVDLAAGLGGVSVMPADYDPEVDVAALGSPDVSGRLLVGETLVDYAMFEGSANDVLWLGRSGTGLVFVPVSLQPLPGTSA